MNLLVFFAIPLATILLAIVLEKILDSPILVGITFFGIYLIIVFTLFALNTITNLGEALVAVIIYTIIAIITAYLTRLIRYILNRINNNNNNENNNLNGDNLLTINCRCNNGNSQNLLTINSSCGENNDNENNCGCQGNNSSNNGIALTRKYFSRSKQWKYDRIY